MQVYDDRHAGSAFRLVQVEPMAGVRPVGQVALNHHAGFGCRRQDRRIERKRRCHVAEDVLAPRRIYLGKPRAQVFRHIGHLS
jgi:hypothetical protein